MEVVIVLSHLMSKEGILDNQSLRRAEKAASICISRDCSILLTSGWAYREDCSIPIGKVVAEYIINQFEIGGKCKVLYDTNSRDTVGDAYYSRKKLSKFNYTKLIIVTSDYHVNRTQYIFKNFFPSILIEIIGIKTNLTLNNNVMQKETASLLTFKQTFKNINFKSDVEIYNTLKNCHPYYNGKKYYKI